MVAKPAPGTVIFERQKCGAGVPARAAHWTTGEDARFTLAACQENIAMSGDRANVEDGCEAGSRNRHLREAKMWCGRPRPRCPLDNGRGRPFYTGGLSEEHRYERGPRQRRRWLRSRLQEPSSSRGK